MYLKSLFKAIFTRNNMGFVAFSCINILLLGPISILYFLIVVFWGESLTRLMMRCGRNVPLIGNNSLSTSFARAYARAKRENCIISDNIKIYVYNSANMDAYAYGRKTICISSAATSLPSRELTTLFMQKFAQFENHDSEMLLLLTAGNITFVILTVVSKIFVYLIGIFIFAVFSAIGAIGGIWGAGRSYSGGFIQEILRFNCSLRLIKKLADVIEKFILLIVRGIMMLGINSYKKNIFSNDEFVCRCGLKNELIYYLTNIEPDNVFDDSIFGTIESMKPDRQTRVDRIQNYTIPRMPPTNFRIIRR